MNRRSFIQNSSILSLVFSISSFEKLYAFDKTNSKIDYYSLFQNPPNHYKPFVRWWWNGNKVEANELSRELRLLKDAGLGGVEINPISFPKRADSLNKQSVRWLSNEWIDLVKHTCEEAKSLDMTSDLIVGSGWPFGSEDLKENERAQVILVFAEKIVGPTRYETSKFNIFQSVDPGVTDKNPLRSPEIISLSLAKDPIDDVADTVNISNLKSNDIITIDVPEGNHVFYAVVKYSSFAMVINGAPGAAGSILNHMDKRAVRSYLDRMSNTMQSRIGALSQYLRALFTDSMELEGCNWTDDFAEEFRRRCGYDLMPYLPLIMFKVGRLGAVVDENYGAAKSEEFKEKLSRIRFDFEFVKACLYRERFTETYLEWCRELRVKSRAQAYGRGFFPLETSLGYDIPEGESWTTNYLRHKLGEEMSDQDYRRGRGYTMINKYVSSAAHLQGKRIVSCEEMTNTYLVFNATLELLKLGSDQSIMSGITHSIWHGFNYSPKEAPFPGWVQYGSYYSEKNNWWPYFKYLNQYKARLSSQLQNADQYTDIAILPANYDLWSRHGVQTDPFPEKLNVPYTSLLWEAINKNGGAADYVTEIIFQDAKIKNGKLIYGNKSYSTLFLPGVQSIGEDTLKKIYDMVNQGGHVYCIDCYPSKSLGYYDMERRDQQIRMLVDKIKSLNKGFVLLEKPKDNNFLEWYADLQSDYKIPHYIKISNPNRFFMQNRYIRDDKSEFFFFQNAHKFNNHITTIQFGLSYIKGKNCWIWNAEDGSRQRLILDKSGCFEYDFGPTESLLIVFDDTRGGDKFVELKTFGHYTQRLSDNWQVELNHSLLQETKNIFMPELKDLKDDPDLVNFTGTVIYRRNFNVSNRNNLFLNLGRVSGISDVYINGKPIGVKWYGRRIYNITNDVAIGNNTIEIKVVTTMGNYLKTLKNNENAQYWVNRPGREQEIQSMGLLGPVEIYNN